MGDLFFPNIMSVKQAEDILKIMDISFHIVVEYSDDDVPNEDNFNSINEEYELLFNKY